MFVFQFKSDQVPVVEGWNAARWGMTRSQVMQAYPCAHIVESIPAVRSAPLLDGLAPTLFIPGSCHVEWYGLQFDTFLYLRSNQLFAVVLRPQQAPTLEQGGKLAAMLAESFGQGLFGRLTSPSNPCLVYERMLSRSVTPRNRDVWTFDVRFTFDVRHPEASTVWLVNPENAGMLYEQVADPFTLTAERVEILPSTTTTTSSGVGQHNAISGRRGCNIGSVRLGMSADEVLERLGKPLRKDFTVGKWGGGQDIWQYAWEGTRAEAEAIPAVESIIFDDFHRVECVRGFTVSQGTKEVLRRGASVEEVVRCLGQPIRTIQNFPDMASVQYGEGDIREVLLWKRAKSGWRVGVIRIGKSPKFFDDGDWQPGSKPGLVLK